MLDAQQAAGTAQKLIEMRTGECDRLEKIYRYLRGTQGLPAVPTGVPDEVRRLAQMSRVNLIPLVVHVPAESLYVSGYRTQDGQDDLESWSAWQANKLDAKQTGVHRAALTYGASYVNVMPGQPGPVVRGLSPRKVGVFYSDENDAWPVYAIENRRRMDGKKGYRLYDDTAVYELVEGSSRLELVGDPSQHDFPVTPFVRFRNLLDLDDDQVGEVEPLMPLQDQIDFTTFGLLVAQHYQAFRQRYIIGWTTDDENEKAKAGASRLWTFGDGKDEVAVGEFGQIDLSGYLSSRESTLEHLATISQTPPHHLLGKLVNLSAEALVAAESGQRRKIAEREITFGEAWEQVFILIALAQKREPDEGAQVRWQDTEARSFAATVDALGKLVQMLGVPAQELWERIPGVTMADVEKWKKSPQGAMEQMVQRLLQNQAPAPAPV
jgi:hypothetical protein